MSRSAEITLPFGEGEYTFRISIGPWRQVQERCGEGPPELLARLAPPFEAMRRGARAQDLVAAGLLGRWRVDDIRAPILFGLIGGGMAPPDATKLVVEWVDGRPWLETLPLAYQVILAAIVGAGDEAASGEPDGEAGPRPSPAASSDTDRTDSTPSAAPSA